MQRIEQDEQRSSLSWRRNGPPAKRKDALVEQPAVAQTPGLLRVAQVWAPQCHADAVSPLILCELLLSPSQLTTPS